MSDELLTTAQAAARLGVSVRRVQALAQSGRLRATKHGRDLVIRAADLEALTILPPGRPKRIIVPPPAP